MSLSSTTSRISYTGNGAVSTYSYTFKVFSQSDLLVTVRNTSGVETTLTIATDYTVTGVGDTGGGTIVLVNASQAWLTAGKLTTGYVLTIRRVPSLVQTTDIRNQGDFYPESHEDTFDQLVMIDQKQQDEIDRSMKLPETVSSADFDPTLPSGIAGSADKVPVTNATGDGWAAASAWIDSADISTAAASAAAAAASETAAAASAVAADASADAALVSETAAAASAASAAAQLASAFFRDVVYITSADSPRTITSADNGKLFNINSSGGAISFTLPTIASTTLPFNVSFKLTTAGNTVTINRASTDTIEGATSATLSTAGQGLDLIADADGSPDNWSAIATPGTVLPIANGGTNASTKSAAFDSLSPMTTGGDLIYGGASGTGTRLANGSAGQVLVSAGGTAAPTWSAPPTSASVGARYATNAGASISNSGGPYIINFEDLKWDTDSAVTTGASWKFTAPANKGGKYLVSANILFDSASWTAGNFAAIYVYKNGSPIAGSESDAQSSVTFYNNLKVTDVVDLAASDYIDVRIQHNRTAGAAALYSAADTLCYISIIRIGT